MRAKSSSKTSAGLGDTCQQNLRSPDVERAYFLKRAAAHDVLAEAAHDDSSRTLHLGFARVYRDAAAAHDVVDAH